MKATNVEIARYALCSERAVGRAIEDGKLDSGELESVIDWAMKMRVKKLGFTVVLDGLCDPVEDLVESGSVRVGTPDVASSEIEYVPDHEHDEGEW